MNHETNRWLRYISTLKARISWLESIVRSRCPDVDLTQDPPTDVEVLDVTILEDTTLQSPAPAQTSTLDISEPSAIEKPNQPVSRSAPGPSAITHEIGLVSLGTNQDPRYIGPSSGYFLARVMLDSVSKQDERLSKNAPFPTKLVEAIQGPLPLPSREMAMQLCDAYFSAINLQYPILHRQTFDGMLERAYEQDSNDPVVKFQVFTVLAIGSAVLSGRIRARIPAESYCLSALQYLDELNLENSLQGVQCLLLLLIFTIHSPFVRVNVWYLNYHCIAALLDLGLQRNISAGAGISLLEQEMRARIFWVIYTFDRVIATMMGRPIGIRDEGCELRVSAPFPFRYFTETDDLDAHRFIGRTTRNTIPTNHRTFKRNGLRNSPLQSRQTQLRDKIHRPKHSARLTPLRIPPRNRHKRLANHHA